MRRAAMIGFLLAGCGPSISAEVHRQTIAQQRAEYEERLFLAERARLDCKAKVERERDQHEAVRVSLQQRVERLERAAARLGTTARGRGGGSDADLAAAVRRVLGEDADVAAGPSGSARWRVPVETWFDAGSRQLRDEADPALDRLAGWLAEDPALAVEVRFQRPAELAAETGPAWTEATERAVVVAAALQQAGIAAARLTLAVNGAAPGGRIVIVIRQRIPGERRVGALDSRAPRRQRSR